MRKCGLTYKQMLDELAKFEQNQTASVIASTDQECPDEGANYVDGAGIYGVHDRDNEGVLHIVCSDHGSMTWAETMQKIRRIVKDLDAMACIKIGYCNGGGPKAKCLKDFNDEPVIERKVLDCTVLDDDIIWNLTLASV